MKLPSTLYDACLLALPAFFVMSQAAGIVGPAQSSSYTLSLIVWVGALR